MLSLCTDFTSRGVIADRIEGGRGGTDQSYRRVSADCVQTYLRKYSMNKAQVQDILNHRSRFQQKNGFPNWRKAVLEQAYESVQGSSSNYDEVPIRLEDIVVVPTFETET